MKNKKVNLKDEFRSITRYYSPKIIGEVNDVYVKLAKVKGNEVPWHSHDNEDELFFVLEGRLTIQIKNQADVPLKQGELYIVPKGTEHRVFCDEECLLMLVENKTTAHTGKVKSSITKSVEEQK